MVNAFSKEEDKFLFQMIYDGGYRLSEICDKELKLSSEEIKKRERQLKNLSLEERKEKITKWFNIKL